MARLTWRKILIMEEKKKKFLKPELEIFDFKNDDIITGSGLAEAQGNAGWTDEDGETFGE
ncbi:MAG: hypothetical protein E7181_03300 [Erysipelotrichaceae bacterium]|nr:hypothetical protein [Erysipelotrichaceae bacterium]